jgi:hypothetical protein
MSVSIKERITTDLQATKVQNRQQTEFVQLTK